MDNNELIDKITNEVMSRIKNNMTAKDALTKSGVSDKNLGITT